MSKRIKVKIPEEVYYHALVIGLKKMVKNKKKLRAMVMKASKVARDRIIKQIKVEL